jgi:hypothetical protein
MNKNDASEKHSIAEQELIVKGCESYLDVIHAINAFEISVCRKAQITINNALDQIADVMALEDRKNLSANFWVSREKSADEDFHGDEIWIGAYLWLGKPIDGMLYLALLLSKNSNGAMQQPEICFALEANAKWKLEEFCNVYRDHPRFRQCDEWGWLAVELPQSLDDPSSLQEGFVNVLNDGLQWRERTKSRKAPIAKSEH